MSSSSTIHDLPTKISNHSRDNEVLVRVNGVSKKFCRDLKKSLWYGVKDVASELLPFGKKGAGIRSQGPANSSLSPDARHLSPDSSSSLTTDTRLLSPDPGLRLGEFWANKDISFELRRGECIGLIGRNGAGKTTLLKMLNGLIKPDQGSIEMRGRVGALIALGAGFNPILTGRENIYVNGSILGLSKEEIDSKIDDIIEFAEIRDFIDSPVQSYSSGMQVRLGFAVATALEPDILIIDEVLAVGDANFRSKCYERIDKVRKNTAVIFVSHNMSQIARLCPISLVLNKGEIIEIGKTSSCILKYEEINSYKAGTIKRPGTGEAIVNEILFEDKNDNLINEIKYGQSIKIKLSIQSKINIDDLTVDICFKTTNKDLVAECNNYVIPKPLKIFASKDQVVITANIENFPLNPGTYHLSCFLMNHNMLVHYDWWDDACIIKVVNGRTATAGTQLIAEWNLTQ